MATKMTWVQWAVGVAAVVVVLATLLTVMLRLEGHDFALGDANAVEFALTTNAAALASTLGIIVALVLLTVQLTAQRYSFHVIELFVRQPVNPALVLLFVTTISFSLWTTATLSPEFVPAESAILALSLGVLCFALLLPYFFFLFGFLRPTNLLLALEQDAIRAVRRVVKGGSPGRARTIASLKVQNLGDIALSAVQLTDIEVAKHSVTAIQRVVDLYLAMKDRVPGAWFQVEETHFLGHHSLTLADLAESRTWLEMRAFLELQRIFNTTLNNVSDVNSAAAFALREIAERALLDCDDRPVARLAMKFFNTFLRAAINRGDVRSAYHVLYQYRKLAESALPVDQEIAVEIAQRIGYYGTLATAPNVAWIVVPAAYDLRKLAEAAGGDFAVDALLQLLATLEARAASTLRDAYKPVVALGSYALAHRDSALAERLARALAAVPQATIHGVAEDLMAVTDPFFWELTDRVINFDYLEEPVRACVPLFRELVCRHARAARLEPGAAGPATASAAPADPVPAVSMPRYPFPGRVTVDD